MTDTRMQLVDWLDDLCVRFIINLPHEELQSVERICFQIEEAQWFYEDFIRPLDPSLPSMNLRKFSLLMFQHCPLSSSYSELHHTQAYEDFLAYKTRVPVRGAIMLNDDMTQAVLVKGWKKGAKWSFPRGKINKDETDLDCAVREVYEETGHDLREAGLVRSEEQMKKIGVSMREQDMMLYVFRGVPMDTYFEPRTRKEISKIAWYKLTDLPTIKRKNQTQQGTGQDLIKENNFYMVAPFLGPLKGWIKQQHKLDRQRTKNGAHLAPPVAPGITDTEEVGETTADEAPVSDLQPADGTFADLVAKLGRGHRSSDALPEVTTEPQEPEIDPAAELKRLLSVGGAGLPIQMPPVEAPGPAQEAQSNPLLAMLHGNKQPAPVPRTPFEQVMSPPEQPQSPHGQHHPRPPTHDHMPPPPFPIHPHQNMPFRGPHQPHVPPPNFELPLRQMHPAFPATHAPNIQQVFDQQAPRPYQRTGDPQFTQFSDFIGSHSPAIPPASKLPPPKLTAHALGLLNAFKAQEKPAAPPAHQPPSQISQNSQMTPRMQQPMQVAQQYDSFTSPHSVSHATLHAPTPPPFHSPPPADNFQPVQPKPRSAHQDSLLNLFRSPSVSAATPSPSKELSEPAELSAHPITPNLANLHTASQRPRPNVNAEINLLTALSQQGKHPGLTSATVSGPVNVPDFETVKKNTHFDTNGHPHSGSRGASPAHHKVVPHQTFIPQQILRREGSIESRVREEQPASPKTTSNVTTPQASTFKPQILKRPQQGAPLETVANVTNRPHGSAGHSPHAHFAAASDVSQGFDRREALPADQKNALLSLFKKPNAPVAHQELSSPHSQHATPAKSPLPRSPLPERKSPQPPTPKSLMSGVISPVSPLPDKSSQQNSPAHLASRSRISSIGDSMPPNLVIPANIPTSHPATAVTQKSGVGSAGEEEYASAGSGGLADSLGSLDKGKEKAAEGKSPVDKSFLLGFLEDVARRGR